ncbi:hypothetical protein MY1884_006616 [Beauveria asiatica]
MKANMDWDTPARTHNFDHDEESTPESQGPTQPPGRCAPDTGFMNTAVGDREMGQED